MYTPPIKKGDESPFIFLPYSFVSVAVEAEHVHVHVEHEHVQHPAA
ncbi:hypothetical protein RV18_GL002103 [Enterococcus termitis]|nr:hypothetical protein RV18_GL002103 [Enterococcus termitis]